MLTTPFHYKVSDKEHIGLLAYEEEIPISNHIKKGRPGVMIVPAFEGLTQLYKEMAVHYATLGYIVLAVDLYGEGKVCSTLEESLAYCMPHIENRKMTREKMLTIYNAFTEVKGLDVDNIAIFGFCLGGMCALDLARAGAQIKGAVSIHGLLAAPQLPENKIQAKLLVLHGYEDPQVPPEKLSEFAQEMDKNKVDWQCHFYSNTKHAFTDPKAAEIGPAKMGREYNELSTARAKQATQAFLAEIFSN